MFSATDTTGDELMTTLCSDFMYKPICTAVRTDPPRLSSPAQPRRVVAGGRQANRILPPLEAGANRAAQQKACLRILSGAIAVQAADLNSSGETFGFRMIAVRNVGIRLRS
jgi:hypothetical protein